MIEKRPTIQARVLPLVCALVACLVAGCATSKTNHVAKTDEIRQTISMAMPRPVVRTNLIPYVAPAPVTQRGCAWSWPHTNALNGYFRIEARDSLISGQWQIVTNTLWPFYVEPAKQQRFFRGWYMHNLYGMIPIRTGN